MLVLYSRADGGIVLKHNFKGGFDWAGEKSTKTGRSLFVRGYVRDKGWLEYIDALITSSSSSQ